jgi:hypothetical protein
VNLWKNIKVQAALALFVAAACTQLAHASVRPDDRNMGPRPAESSAGSSMPSQAALDALGARWNAIAESYDARPASSYYSKQALEAMGQRGQAQISEGASFPTKLHTALGELNTYAPGVTDFPTKTPETDAPATALDTGPTGAGYLVNGQLVEPGSAGTSYVVGGQVIEPGSAGTGSVVDDQLIEPRVQWQTQRMHGAVRPDDRAGIRSVDDSSTIVYADNGFDWRDASVGAIGAFGTCLLLLGCALLAASHRKHRPAVL